MPVSMHAGARQEMAKNDGVVKPGPSTQPIPLTAPLESTEQICYTTTDDGVVVVIYPNEQSAIHSLPEDLRNPDFANYSRPYPITHW
jgi:hypothetical protein